MELERENLVKAFEMDFQVGQCECDLNNHMKASAILAQCQEISTRHCNAIGMTMEKYNETYTVFLLAKASLEIYDKIFVEDNIHMITKPSSPVRAVYSRYTELYNQRGALVASMDSKWVLVDTVTRKILRNPPEELGFPFIEQMEQSHNFDIPKGVEGEFVGSEKVKFSQTDINKHLNNTRYADVICDYLPIEIVSSKPIKKLDINYHNEAMLGDTMDIYVTNFAENKFYICGKRKDTKKYFEASIEF